jgi:hypothetical protein
MMGFEPMTSSLPRKCSTPELHRLDSEGPAIGAFVARKPR